MPRSPFNVAVPALVADLIAEKAQEEDLRAAVSECALGIGVKPRTLYEWIEKNTIPGDAYPLITEWLGAHKGARLGQALVGRRLEVLPALTGEGLSADAMRAAKESSEAVTAIIAANMDGEFSDEERPRLLKEVRDARFYLGVLERELEAG